MSGKKIKDDVYSDEIGQDVFDSHLPEDPEVLDSIEEVFRRYDTDDLLITKGKGSWATVGGPSLTIKLKTDDNRYMCPRVYTFNDKNREKELKKVIEILGVDVL